MVSTIFALIAVAEIALLVQLGRGRTGWATRLLALVVLGLVWDNLVIAAGRLIGTGPLLEGLSVPRFVTHALFVPLLIPVGVGLGRRFGVRWLGGRAAPAGFGVLTALMIGLGVWQDVVVLDLEPEVYGDTVRYTNAASSGPPIPAVVAIWVLIAVGVAVLARARWPWLLAGAVGMLVAAGAGFAVPWLGNLGEFGLALGLWWTAVNEPIRESSGKVVG
ncbi:hypothetical protein [Actinoplanes sp. HUAS TT8]|uniref:hypothetical protein n=1 Tax=Actinoplanes sp. HUAS TT8 TaxID=3447453 RepID=UPI003F528641